MESANCEGQNFEDKFKNAIENFYMTNVICRASGVMADCVKAFLTDDKNKKKAA
jgi:hypothetical protein